jgi:phage N-6-adenine-methyltransferase
MNTTWATRQRFFDRVNARFKFTLDVCALPETAKCARYFTPEQDGLAQEWTGNVFMNPPYGAANLDRWLSKAMDSAAAGATVVALVPTRTNPPWWHKYILRAHEIHFVVKKLGFDGPKDGVPFTGHALVVFRPSVLPATGPACFSWYQTDDEEAQTDAH